MQMDKEQDYAETSFFDLRYNAEQPHKLDPETYQGRCWVFASFFTRLASPAVALI
jgi:hypothetical protein